MALAGAWVQDSGGRYGVGPVDSATGAGKAWRAANISGDYADGRVVLFNSANVEVPTGSFTPTTVVTGIPTGLPLARYNGTPATLTENYFSHLQIDQRGNLRTSLWDRDGTTGVDTVLVNNDNVSASNQALAVGSFSLGFDGTAWDLNRSGPFTAATTAPRVLPTLGLAVYNATSTTFTDGQYGHVHMGTRGAQHVTLMANNSTTSASIGTGGNPSDALAAGAPLYVAGFNLGWNGTTWDRLRSGAQADIAAATGFSNVLPVGQYNATPPTVTDTRYQHVQVDSRANLKVSLWSGATGLSIGTYPNTDALGAGLNALAAGALGMTFNGMTWDRTRSIVNATNSTGTGIAAVGLVGQYDDTAPTAITENQFGTVRMDSARALRVNVEGAKTTYSAGFIALAPAITATDILEILGSDTKTVRITRIQISGVATAAGAYSIQLLKRSTAATGGTSTSATIVPHDSANAAGTAVVKGYTANPTTGTLVGIVQVKKITVSTAAGAIPIVPTELSFELRGEQAIVLRGAAQSLCINLNGVTMTGGALDIDVTLTEE